jgi:hypothetical protein
MRRTAKTHAAFMDPPDFRPGMMDGLNGGLSPDGMPALRE